jgi:hypothetical protein
MTAVRSARRLAVLLLAMGVALTAGGCGSSHRANDHRVRIAAYSGDALYSVRHVMQAFAALGLELHRGAVPRPGLVLLLNNARLGPQRIPSPPRVVTVVVVTRRDAGGTTELERGRNAQLTRYANITVLSTRDVLDQVRGAMARLRWGTAANVDEPRPGLIVLGSSIDRIRLDESRTSVEKAFGAGRSIRRGVVSYFGGRLIVNYWFHDGLYKQVQYLETRWRGYRTRSGAHVGSSRRELGSLFVTCANGECVLLAGPHPDPVGTVFTMRHGAVADIDIGRFG